MLFYISFVCYFQELPYSFFQNHVIALDDAAKEVIEIDEEKIEKNSKSKFTLSMTAISLYILLVNW